MRTVLAFIALLYMFCSFAFAEDVFLQADVSTLGSGWRVAVFKSGYIYEEGFGSNGVYTRLHHVSKSAIKAIEQAIFEGRFLALPDRIEPVTYTEDADLLYSITVKTALGEKGVSIEGVERAKDAGAARRFMVVWDAIKTVIPEKS